MLCVPTFNNLIMKNLLIVLLFIPAILFSQGWERTFGGDNDDFGYSVQQTTDGGYIITGHTQLEGNDTLDVYLIRTDSNGDTLWTKIYGGEDVDYGSSVQQTADGGFIIAGYTRSFGNGNLYLIKTDDNGDTLWTKTHGGYWGAKGRDIKQTYDGGYIITGSCSSGGNTEIFLFKSDSFGDTVWVKIFNGYGWETGHSVQQTSDGGYVLAGTGGFGGLSDIYVVKTDSIGITLWTKVYGGDSYEFEASIQQTTDLGYFIAGNTYSFGNGYDDVYLIKTDSNGDTLWTKTYGGGNNDGGYSAQQTSDGGFIIVGYTGSYGVGNNDVYLIKTDNNGDTLWTKTFGDRNWDRGHSVQQTTDGGYIITGWITTSERGSTDVYLIKTDENGIVTFTSEIPIQNTNRKLVKTVDLLGREIRKPKDNHPYIEIYDDGTTQKKMKIK
jgi:hypothetical protein